MENLTIFPDLEKVNRDTFLERTMIIINTGSKQDKIILNCIENAFDEDFEKIKNVIIIKGEIELNEMCLNFATAIYYASDESIKQVKSRNSPIKGIFLFISNTSAKLADANAFLAKAGVPKFG